MLHATKAPLYLRYKLSQIVAAAFRRECTYVCSLSVANVNIPDGNAEDLLKECNDYEEKILQAGGIELFIGGRLFISSK